MMFSDLCPKKWLFKFDELWSWLVDRHRSQWLLWPVKLGIFFGSSLGGKAPPRSAELFRWVKYHHFPRFLAALAAPKKMERDGKGWTLEIMGEKSLNSTSWKHFSTSSWGIILPWNCRFGPASRKNTKRTTSPIKDHIPNGCGRPRCGFLFLNASIKIEEFACRIAEAWTTGALGMAP